MLNKKCDWCHRTFEVTVYNKRFCSEKCKNKSKNSERKRRIKYSEQTRAYNLKQSFGISIDEYNILFLNQDGCCAICNRHQTELNKRLAVDHCHKTGKIRGLLCSNCNTGIGNLRDSIELLEKAIGYLNNGKI